MPTGIVCMAYYVIYMYLGRKENNCRWLWRYLLWCQRGNVKNLFPPVCVGADGPTAPGGIWSLLSLFISFTLLFAFNLVEIYIKTSAPIIYNALRTVRLRAQWTPRRNAFSLGVSIKKSWWRLFIAFPAVTTIIKIQFKIFTALPLGEDKTCVSRARTMQDRADEAPDIKIQQSPRQVLLFA